MVKKQIKINSINDIYKLASATQKVDGDVLVIKGHYAVDGKSIMGLFSLDLSEGVTIIYPEDAINFEKEIEIFIYG